MIVSIHKNVKMKFQTIALMVLAMLVVVAMVCVTDRSLADDKPTAHGNDNTGQDDAAHGKEHAHQDGSGEHAQEHTVNPNPLTLDPDLAIVTAIVFLLLLLILAKYAWGPIVEALDNRERGIADQLDEARQINEQAKKMSADYESKLAAAADEVRSLLDEARRDAELTKQRVVAEAQEAAAAERDRALREIELAKYNALHELSDKSVTEAFHLAGNVVRRELSREDHSDLIQDTLERFPKESSLN